MSDARAATSEAADLPAADRRRADEVRAADGRLPGRRGQATRRRLLERTADMLKVTSYRDLKVIDIAREAGTSPATFYQYFEDVEAAVLVLAEDLVREGRSLTTVISASSWRGRNGYRAALALVDGFLDFWERHRSALRVVDLATGEGDVRFRKIRVHMLNDVTTALSDVIRQFKLDGRHPDDVEPMATAGALVSMLAHVAAHTYGFEFWGIRVRDVRTSMARQCYWAVTGHNPPRS